jgi:hypothetical protein
MQAMLNCLSDLLDLRRGSGLSPAGIAGAELRQPRALHNVWG